MIGAAGSNAKASRRTRALVRVAWPTVAAVRLGLWAMPGPMLRVVARANAGTHDVDAQPIADAVRRASRFVPRASCLVQAVSTQLLLTLRGSPGTIVLGARRTDGGLAAHAWVEHGGRIVIGEGPPPCYEVLGPLRAPTT
jgi:hypothetical protein